MPNEDLFEDPTDGFSFHHAHRQTPGPQVPDTFADVRLSQFKSTIYDAQGNRLAECYSRQVAERLVALLNKGLGS